MKGKLLEFDSLSQDEREFLLRQSFADNQGNFDIYSNMVHTLFSWGVMCFHPPEKRISRSKMWFECLACGCAVPELTRKVDQTTG